MNFDMTKDITVTVNDYNRLVGLIEFAALRTKMPDITTRLYTHLKNAKTLPQDTIDNTVVTMNSRICLKDINHKRETEITLTYPQDAQPREGKVSVLSEVGVALLGRKENEVVSWKTPRGMGTFQITKVTYQPEAAGDYFL